MCMVTSYVYSSYHGDHIYTHTPVPWCGPTTHRARGLPCGQHGGTGPQYIAEGEHSRVAILTGKVAISYSPRRTICVWSAIRY